MEYLNTDSLMLPLMTGAVAISRWPTNQFFVELGKYEIYQYLCLFVLIYQGGGGQNLTLSAVATLVFFTVYKILDMTVNKRNEGYY